MVTSAEYVHYIGLMHKRFFTFKKIIWFWWSLFDHFNSWRSTSVNMEIGHYDGLSTILRHLHSIGKVQKLSIWVLHVLSENKKYQPAKCMPLWWLVIVCNFHNGIIFETMEHSLSNCSTVIAFFFKN